MSNSSSRLERALELYCACQRRGGDLRELMVLHPELADEFGSFLDEDPVVAPAQFPPDYEPVRELGRGGVGVVYEARQRSLTRRVALKLLHEGFASGPAALARFHREAQVLARLEHPGIVRVFAADATASPPWLAMEFVDGKSLADHLDRLRESGHHGATIRMLVAAIVEVASALHHAHQQGIVHRDVKPSNILLRDDGSAVLTDFGLARDADAPSLTRTGVAAGTPYYMAPERILGGANENDPRADVFSLGLTLYECLALRRAYEGATSQEVLQRILSDDAPDLRRLAPGVSTELAAIVHKAIERDPARRYVDAAAFAEDLRAFLDLRPVAARPVSRTRRWWRSLRRHPVRGAGLLLGAGGLLLAMVFAWQWPELRAAAQQRLTESIEEELVLGTAARFRRDAAQSYAHFRRVTELLPDDEIGFAGLCFAISMFEGPLQALQAIETEVVRRPEIGGTSLVRRLRAGFLRKLQRNDEADRAVAGLAPPSHWLELWVEAQPLMQDTADREAFRRASQLLAHAILVAPRPRLWLHLQYAEAQMVTDDKPARRAAGEALMELWPDNPKAMVSAGTCLMQADPERAVALLQRAVDAGEVEPRGRVNLAIAMIFARRVAEAVPLLAAGALDSGLSDAHRQRCLEILHQVQAFDDLAGTAVLWLEREPDNLTARRFAARSATLQGDHERALSLFRSCVEALPNDVEVSQDLAFALMRADDAAGAAAVLVPLVQAHPDHARAHAMLLDVCDALEDAAGKIAELERWLTVKPDDAGSWCSLAERLLDAGGAHGLQRALEAAEQGDYLQAGRDVRALQLRAVALERLGKVDEAARVQARAAALPPQR